MNNDDILNLVFKVSSNVDFEVNDDLVTIIEKQDHFVQKFFRKLKFKIPMYKKIELDKYSSFVFLQIDGKNTVEDIGLNLENVYGEDSHPLYERLLVFLNHIEVNCKYIEKTS
jgi:hypothetical protein